MKWSVVIPTMWRSSKTLDLISGLSESDLVSEVIIIDNDPLKKPDIPKIEKVKILAQSQNIFVNPAWNLGISQAIENRVALCNDDITFDISILNLVNKYPQLRSSVIGCHPLSFEMKPESSLQSFIEKGHYIGQGWGCLMFLMKNNYKNIPNQMKIWCGDDWLAGTHRHTFSILFPISAEMSVTSADKAFQNILEFDKKHFQQSASAFVKYRSKFSHTSQAGELSYWEFLRHYFKDIINRLLR